MEQLTLLSEEVLVRDFPLQADNSDSMTNEADLHLLMFDYLKKLGLDGLCGKTSRASSRPMVGTISEPLSKKLLKSGMAYRGAFLTLNMSEYPDMKEPSRKDGDVSSLLDILETGSIQPKYYLSPRACQGILNRAAKRGKALPPMLKDTLEAMLRDAEQASQPS